MDEIANEPYVEWLENAVKAIFENQPTSMALVATLEDGSTLTAYYNADAQDKAVFAHHIQSDVTMDIIMNNLEEIRSGIEELECSDD